MPNFIKIGWFWSGSRLVTVDSWIDGLTARLRSEKTNACGVAPGHQQNEGLWIYGSYQPLLLSSLNRKKYLWQFYIIPAHRFEVFEVFCDGHVWSDSQSHTCRRLRLNAAKYKSLFAALCGFLITTENYLRHIFPLPCVDLGSCPIHPLLFSPTAFGVVARH